MTHDWDERQLEEEMTRLALSDEAVEPPAEIEQRVLKTARSLRAANRRRTAARVAGVARWVLPAAAAAAVVFLLGRWSVHPTAPTPGPVSSSTDRNRYLFLLYEGEGFGPAAEAAEGATLVREYAEWARSLRHEGIAINGEKLGAGAVLLTRSGGYDVTDETEPASRAGDLGTPVGLFVVEADDLAHAEALARTSPHLRYGGRILLRPIQGTGG